MGIDPAGWTLLVVVGVMVGLAVLKTAPDLVLLGGLVLLVVLGVFPETSLALSGFANEGLVTVAVLFVVAEGMKQTGGLGPGGRGYVGLVSGGLDIDIWGLARGSILDVILVSRRSENLSK